ncbi:hypothetical protein BL254_21560 [Protofrankia sp. BMG5.30]|uniref:Major facilitator superfamily (MFS) profile domain-containing protein n=1 Tax=Protofrankia coriariae TaxID=1562887 RepID=A0ABR5EZ23_9ACTN|nr:hypothetical protein [Protofrankia coriariae]KLL09704.1 hypothetical protein FrCorBMG51_23015 [Protofrankia coriariae]ONH32550.1 hypothetical protein BL254_21560 [Protofrankia sp. BMG5.30]
MDAVASGAGVERLIRISSLIGGLAGNPGVLVGARLVQGLGVALMLPAALSILTTTFTEGTGRHKALGVRSGAGSAVSRPPSGCFSRHAAGRSSGVACR